MEQFLRFEELDTAVSLFRSWRQQLEHGLVIVDQFEELFTFNAPEVQERFAELLGRLSIEADVHVLLSMRDDFLYHCHAFEPLHPLLIGADPLGSSNGCGSSPGRRPAGAQVRLSFRRWTLGGRHPFRS